MKNEPNPKPAEPKKGFFASLVARLDNAMKSAADKKAGCCCAGDDKKAGKGGKCC